MKFFCDQCKAKYQIADEKVAGKTVRMKCRKCGHIIELRAEVTESSAIAHAAPLGRPPPGGQRAIGVRPPRSRPRPSRRPGLRPSRTPSPRASPSTKPARAEGRALRRAARSRAPSRATSSAKKKASAPFDMADLAPGDDWYVAVNGVPVGPIRVAEVRRKAALGAVTEDSLVWQEGLDEWRPLKTFPDLAANVREAAASGASRSRRPRPTCGRAALRRPRSPSMRAGPGERRSVARSLRRGPCRPTRPPPPAREQRRALHVATRHRRAARRRADRDRRAARSCGGGGPGSLRGIRDPFASQPPMAPPGDRAPLVATASLAPPSRAAVEARAESSPPWMASSR